MCIVQWKEDGWCPKPGQGISSSPPLPLHLLHPARTGYPPSPSPFLTSPTSSFLPSQPKQVPSLPQPGQCEDGCVAWAVCLLHSHRRTVLCKIQMWNIILGQMYSVIVHTSTTIFSLATTVKAKMYFLISSKSHGIACSELYTG